MEPTIKKLGFAAACLQFFGKKDKQSNMEFMQELRSLTNEDREYLTREFRTVGIEII